MIAIILKLIFIYFLFVFLKSLIKGWFLLKGPIKDIKKMKEKMEQENRYRSQNMARESEKAHNSQTIEAEYRVIKD